LSSSKRGAPKGKDARIVRHATPIRSTLVGSRTNDAPFPIRDARRWATAVPTLFPFYNVVRTVTFLVLLVSLVVAYANSPLLHDTNDDDDDDETRTMKYASYYVHAIGLYAIAGAVSYLPTRLAVRRFHDRMAAVVQELSPLFRKAGYDIQYCRSSWNNGTGSGGSDSSQNRSFLSRCGAAVASLFHNESFVRFVPYPRALSSEEVDKARVLWDVPTTAVTTTTARTGFRVAVYGFLACPELGSVKSQGANFFSSLRVVGATDHVDLFTRGAVATEMRPYAEMYRQARFWTTLAALVACIIPMWMPDWFYKSWFSIIGLFGVLIAAELVLFCPTGLETWWLLHVRRQLVFDQMRATIQRLSPLVEERAGYSLRLQVEPDGCLGGTAAYVHFEPTSSSPSAGGGDAGGGPVLC
jgi:hypothetical protein